MSSTPQLEVQIEIEAALDKRVFAAKGSVADVNAFFDRFLAMPSIARAPAIVPDACAHPQPTKGQTWKKAGRPPLLEGV